MHRSLANASALAIILSVAGIGCVASEEPASDHVAATSEPIAGGYIDPNDTAVVGIYDYSVGALCSGSLIAPNVVLTARHCVSPVLDEVNGGVACSQTRFGAFHPASVFFVTTKTQFSQNPSDYHTVREVIGLPVTNSSFCGNDQAILILSAPIDPAEAVPLVPRVDSELGKGEEYNAIGFGGTDANADGAGTRRRRDSLYIDCVASGCPAYMAAPTEFVGDQGICNGDSGGPSIDMLGRVIGVTSRGGLDCSSPIYGYVFGWAQWIKDTVSYAAGIGGYTAPAWTTGWPTDPAYSPSLNVGQACSQASDCASNWCISTNSSSLYCTRMCNDAAPCPDGYQCDTGQTNACVAVPAPAKKSSHTRANASSGCSVAERGSDPTKPVPWFTGIGIALGLAAARRRRRGRG